MLKINESIMSILNYLKSNGKITRSERPYSGLSFYLTIWYLRDKGIIYCDGVNERREKVWVLTDRGKRVIDILDELEKIT